MSEKSVSSDVKTRFCPSPTGYVHLGNVRTALFSALFAKHAKGTFLLRIEDTDRERSDSKYTDALMQDLRWLGLQWQEGVDAGGDLGPYHQSKRQAIYDDYYERLISMKMAYPCFCTEAQLSLQRKVQRTAGKPPRYAGTCLKLSEQEIEKKIAAGEKPTLRFHMPKNETITFIDLVRGDQRFDSSDIGDFVIRRADGTAPFMYGNAIDDALMGVTNVLRGEDHLTNTPRQITILKTLGLPIPNYGHIALIVGQDGSPLSKRHGSRNVKELRESGYLPHAIVNYLARLGHYYGHDEYLTFDALAEQFKIQSLSKSPAKFNEKQLLYWQTAAVSRLSDVDFWGWVGAEVKAIVPSEYQAAFVKMIKPNVQFPADVKRWAVALFEPLSVWDEEQNEIIKAAGKDFFSEALVAVKEHGVDVKAMTVHLKEKCGVKGKGLFLPLRVALTAHRHGPDLSELLSLMHQDEIISRLEKGAAC